MSLLRRQFAQQRRYSLPIKIVKSSKNPSFEWYEIECKSQQEIFQLLNTNEPLRQLFDSAISMVPELRAVKEEMNRYMQKQGYMSTVNPNIIDQRYTKEIMEDKKLEKMRTILHDLLAKYGFLVPAGGDEQAKEPLNLFGPAGRLAAVLQSSVPPRRIGMQTILKSDYDEMVMEQKGIFGRFRYRFSVFYNKWFF
jgi:hypothetical protein